MSGADDVRSLRRGHLEYLPVVPGRMEFAAVVRQRFLDLKPKAVAVELPSWLDSTYIDSMTRLPEITAIVYPEERDSDRAVYVLVEPADPFVEGLRSALYGGAEMLFMEPERVDRPHLPGEYPDSHALASIGYEKYVEAYRLRPQPRDEEMEAHAAAMAWRLQGSNPDKPTLVVLSLNLLDAVLDAMQVPQEAPPLRDYVEPEGVNPHPDCLAEILQEPPYVNERYEQWRKTAEGPPPDRRKLQLELLKEAERNYEAQTGDQLRHWQRRLVARYARNLAMMESVLVAGLFDLTVAARSIVDDNYGWEVWNAANQYSYQTTDGPFGAVNLSAEEVYLHSRKVRLRRREPRAKRRLLPRGLKKRPKERYAGEWAEQLDGSSICSYPPEDLVIEDYGKSLRQQAKSLLSDERTRVEPFVTSMLDGIDVRETIRNWHEGKIYVRRTERLSGDVGAVVVIFDEDRENRYNYLTTWLGEHQNESDMAFYATQPFEHMVGPGIGRAEYGGFLMALPPRRMYDVWHDSDYDFAETKAERLLLAALDYSLERHVVYAAAKPPRTIFRSVAAHLNRQILYIPLGQLSPSKLKKLRVVHVLDSHERRKIAKDYLW